MNRTDEGDKKITHLLNYFITRLVSAIRYKQVTCKKIIYIVTLSRSPEILQLT